MPRENGVNPWRDLVSELDSPLSGYLSLQAELEGDLPTEKTPLAVEPLSLLPVRHSAVEEYLKGRDEKVIKWVMSLVEVLTYHAVMGKVKMGPPTLTPAQEYMVTRLCEAVEYFIAQEGELPSVEKCKEALATRFDYGGEPVQYMEELVARSYHAGLRLARPQCRTPLTLSVQRSVSGSRIPRSVCYRW